MDNLYKIERTKEGTKVHQIIDGWNFETIVPSSVPIIIKEKINEEKGE